MNAGIEPTANDVATANRNRGIDQAHDEVIGQANLKPKQRENQQVGNVINPKTNQHIDEGFDQRSSSGLTHDKFRSLKLHKTGNKLGSPGMLPGVNRQARQLAPTETKLCGGFA